MVQEKFSFSEALKARSGQKEMPRPAPPAPPAPEIPSAGRFDFSYEEQKPAQRQASENWSDYIDYRGPRQRRGMPEERSFPKLCEDVMEVFFRDWEERDSSRSALEIQKRAIIGYEKEKSFFKNRIADILRDMDASDAPYPPWYESLTDAIYHENWGLAGLAEWFRPNYAFSSSAKIIGENMYFLENGRMALKPQKISKERKDQLIKAFLLLTPEERMDKSYHETYLLDGTRVTIFTAPMAKAGQEALIFRRYVVPSLSFEEQARRGTIPQAAIPLFQTMVKLGFNVAFVGAVRTAKTTYLSTWQALEDPALEGVMVETDPEIPMDRLLPGAPILQLIADGEDLRKISKNLLRSDADYFILAEARDGIALDTAVRIASKGTKRMKMTFHTRSPRLFPLEVATEIVKSTGGDLPLTMQKAAGSFDYIFHFIQLSDKSRKRLKGIYQMNVDGQGSIAIEPLCEYDPVEDSWTFRYAMGPAQEEYGRESDHVLLEEMRRQLKALEAGPPYPSEGAHG
ncbi:MAG: Flp pilus assembly complex ATPase component TadA [Firmicutes bacterium]|nr:Flp pilus assembly complex ATPase component TadA [Bacillota bacterium]